MEHLQTYEELNLKNLFSSTNSRNIDDIISSINKTDWGVLKKGQSYELNKKIIKNKELENINIKLTLQKENLEILVSIVPKYPRTKVCKQIFNLIKFRPVIIDYNQQKLTIRYDVSDKDFNFKIKQTFKLLSAKEINNFLKIDFEEVYSTLIEEWNINDLKERQNVKKINLFFSKKNKITSYFNDIKALSDSWRVEESEKYNLTKMIQLYNPKFEFLFKFEDSNFLRKSTKKLILTDTLIKSLDLLNSSMKKILKLSDTTLFEVFVSDKVLFVNVRNSDPETTKLWEQQQEEIFDYFIGLEDFSQSSSITVLRAYSPEEQKSIFAGYTVSFNFQSIIANIEQSYRIMQPMLLFKGLINQEILQALKKSIQSCRQLNADFEDIETKTIITDKQILITIELEVESTWQGTTRKEHLQDEMDFGELAET